MAGSCPDSPAFKYVEQQAPNGELPEWAVQELPASAQFVPAQHEQPQRGAHTKPHAARQQEVVPGLDELLLPPGASGKPWKPSVKVSGRLTATSNTTGSPVRRGRHIDDGAWKRVHGTAAPWGTCGEQPAPAPRPGVAKVSQHLRSTALW